MDVMKRQHTSWTIPQQSEKEFNKRSGILRNNLSFINAIFRQLSISVLIIKIL